MKGGYDILIVNLFEASRGIDNLAPLYIYSHLKANGIDAMLITDYITIGNIIEDIDNKKYFKFKCYKFNNKAKIIITDNPLPLSISLFKNYNNANYILQNNSITNSNTEIDLNELKDLFNKYSIEYKKINNNVIGYNCIINDILNKLKRIETN